jgi:dipeptidyl aminopeptidase/acylaminoacyl peptidase
MEGMFMRFRLLTMATGSLLLGCLLATPNRAYPQGLSEINTQAAGGKRGITEKDLFNFTWITDPQLSPDGSQVAFTRVVVDQGRSGYETSIWTVATKGDESPVRMTNGKDDANPRWSPDGRRIAFTRGGEKDDAGKPIATQIAVLSLTGGESRILTRLPQSAGNPIWSPDGKRVAFLSSTNREDIEKQEPKTKASGPEDEHVSDIHIVTRAMYRDGRDYLDFRRHDHLWVVDVPSNSDQLTMPVQLSRSEFDDREPVWAHDGSKIYFLTTDVQESYYYPSRTDIDFVSSSGGERQKVATIPMYIFDFALSPDDRQVAFHGGTETQPVRAFSEFRVWGMDLTNGAKPRNLTADYDFNVGNSVSGDNEAPRGGDGLTLHWSPDSRWLYGVVNKEGRTVVIRVDSRSGKVTEITHGEQAVLDLSVTPDARNLVVLVSTPTMIGDLFSVTAEGAQHRITDLNQKLWSKLNLTPPEEITYASFDGRRIQGWIQKPPGFDPHKRYPMVLCIHGGPFGAWGWIFDYQFQWLAANGYVVLYVNPRGSNGYGQEFGNIIQYNFPGDDFKDLMAGVDEVVRRGYVDPDRLGVTGGSAGGLLTNWVITQTNRFKAAVSERDIADQAAEWYLDDYPEFIPRMFRGAPWQVPSDYAALSPISHIDKVKTPLMLIQGDDDGNVPPAAGTDLIFRALKFLHQPVVMVRFPGEGHGLPYSGQPWHRAERFEHMLNWFDKYLQGREIHLYDAPAGDAP